jgi:aminomethyltransferase
LEPSQTIRKTAFHAYHLAAGAKLIDFAGYEMPVRYTGDVHEHMVVRRAAGLFDVSHMGEFEVRGAGAGAFLDTLVTNDVAALEVGQALYSPVCRPGGTIVDDVLVYRFHDRYMVVVNAANRTKDFAWFLEHCPADVSLEDHSDATALLALQGPKAAAVLQGHMSAAAFDLGTYRFMEGDLFGVSALLSRTGYTGEDGFELYFDPAHAATVWEGLVAAGAAHGLEPVGLGARDTLRLEMGYMLYGNDIDETTTPLEAGLGWTVKFSKSGFNGRDALIAQKARGLTRKLVGIDLEGRRMPRHGMTVLAEGRPVGQVASGTFSPSLERPIGMAYVEAAHGVLGTILQIDAGRSRLDARVVRRPFYTEGSRRQGAA